MNKAMIAIVLALLIFSGCSHIRYGEASYTRIGFQKIKADISIDTNGVCIVKIDQFSDGSAKALENAVREAVEASLKANGM